jgi:TfoX/Sxy family transcriptional regulator of competence genes
VAYDEGMAQRIREMLAERTDTSEMRMFGGIAFLVRGNMAVGVVKDDLMVRVGPDAHGDLVALPHARPMDFTGRPLKGLLFVAAEGVESDADLRQWIEHGVSYAGALPAK